MPPRSLSLYIYIYIHPKASTPSDSASDLQVAGLAAYKLSGLDRLPAGSVPGFIRDRLLVYSRPIAPTLWPKVIWNGLPENADAGALMGNETSGALLQLVSNATIGEETKDVA